jgi:indole-3-glycerol phosphate synthase
MLTEIIEHKREELRLIKDRPDYEKTLSEIKRSAESLPQCRDFFSAVKGDEGGDTRVIAEVKKASPSNGVLRQDLDPVMLAKAYEGAGARAISVLTDERYFQGSLSDLKAVKENVGIPVLRKDFIIDGHQVFEARAFGADAILLIAGALTDEGLKGLKGVAEGLGLHCLVEVHDEEDLNKAIDAGSKIIGINNRDLSTMKVDISTTKRLSRLVPPALP